MVISMALVLFYFWLKSKSRVRLALSFVLSLVAIWEIFFAVQSQLFPEPLIDKRLMLAAERPVFLGYNRLEDYVRDFFEKHPAHSYILVGETPQIRSYRQAVIQTHIKETGSNQKQQEYLVVYDNRMDWAARVWIFERRGLYRADIMPTLSNFIESIKGDYLEKFKELGFSHALIIVATSKMPRDQAEQTEELDQFAQNLEKFYPKEKAIKNHKGEIIFEIFRLSLGDNFGKLVGK